MIKNKIHLVVAVAMMLVGALTGCDNKNRASDRTITVSIEPQRYLVEQIAGDRWTVNTLLAKGADPENFDPSMSAIQGAMNSQAIFLAGNMAFETSLLNRIGASGSDIDVVNTSEGIDILHGTHDCGNPAHHHHHDGDGGGDDDDDADPHTWTSVKNSRLMARNIYNYLIKADPEGEAYYTERFNALAHSLDSLDQAITAQLADIPTGHRAFLVWHPSLSYMARDYGLEQISIGAEGKELSAKGFRDKIDHARSVGAKVFFVQPDYDRSRSEAIAREVGATTVTVNLIEADYLQQLSNVASSLHDAYITE